MHAEREALTPLLARARRLVKGEPQMVKVADARRAAAANPALHEPLRAGRLSEEPESSGFGGLEGLDAAAGAGNETDADDSAREAEEQAARAERERRDLEKAAERAEREAARLDALP